MLPEERRKHGSSHIIRLHDPMNQDLEVLAGSSPQARMEALWDLTLEYLIWIHSDEREPRLQRSICRVERRQG